MCGGRGKGKKYVCVCVGYACLGVYVCGGSNMGRRGMYLSGNVCGWRECVRRGVGVCLSVLVGVCWPVCAYTCVTVCVCV